MDSANHYTTTGAVFDYLVEINQKTGVEPTFPMAVEGMRRRGLLQTSPPPFPPFYSNMDREDFRNFIRALPISAGLFLTQTNAFLSNRTIQEPNLFPVGKDVFCFLNMPYMDRQLHFHDFFEIAYVVEGSCTFLFEGESASLGIGDVCITSPMAAHSLPLEPGCTALSIVVRKSTFNSLFPNLLSSQNLVSLFFRNSLYERRRANYILIRTGNDEVVFRTAQQLTYECNLADDFSNPCSISLLNLFLARALRAGAEVSLHHYENYSEQDFDFTLILLYIQQNYRTVTLSSLAETFHFSETYLSKLIHKNMDRSFTDVLRSLKMERAMDFLMNTPMKVSEIALAVGYDSVDHFSRTFRRVYGASPQQYKQANNPAKKRPRDHSDWSESDSRAESNRK